MRKSRLRQFGIELRSKRLVQMPGAGAEARPDVPCPHPRDANRASAPGSLYGVGRGVALQLPEGQHGCSYCGGVLDVPPNGELTVMLWATAEGTIIRSLMLEGEELHSCEVMHAPERP